jgi:hypothetical protein
MSSALLKKPHELLEFNNSNLGQGRGGSPALRETTRR